MGHPHVVGRPAEVEGVEPTGHVLKRHPEGAVVGLSEVRVGGLGLGARVRGRVI